MVATRSLQLTVKKTTRTMKTLEGQLLMIRNGERVSMSSRVAELDQMLPQYLGVSKAVLDNVIFCHQDESLWPMSEPSTLKKKFDEIFEALKYTKAIDNIKVLGKKQKEELGKLKIIEQHAKEDKDKGERAEKRSGLLSDEIEALRVKTKDLKTQIEDATNKANDAWQRSVEFSTILSKLSAKREEAAYKQRTIEDIGSTTDMMKETEQELTAMLESYAEKSASYKSDLTSQRAKYQSVVQQLNANSSDISAKEREQGKHQSDRDRYYRDRRARQEVINQTAQRHKIRGFEQGFEHELEDEEVQEFMERIKKMERDQKAAHDRARREDDAEYNDAQKVLDNLNQQKNSQSGNKKHARARIEELDRKVNHEQNNHDRMKVDEGAKVALESRLADIESKQQSARTELEQANYDKQIRDAEVQVQSLDGRKNALDSEMLQATNQAAETARVDFIHQSLKDSQAGLNTMLGAHNDRITKTLGGSWEAKSLNSEYQRMLRIKESDLKEAEQQRDSVNRELELLESKRSIMQSELKAKQKTMTDCQKEVREALGEDDLDEYENELRTVEINRDQLKADVENYETMGDFFQKCSATFKANQVCRLCERTFRTEKESSKFQEKLEKMVSKAVIETTKDELAALEEDLKKLRAVRSDYDTWKRLLEQEIPTLETEIGRLSNTRIDLLSRLEEKDQGVEERSGNKRDLESISATVGNITKYNDDIAKFNEQIEDLASKQSQSVARRGIHEIRDAQVLINQDSAKMMATLTELRNDRDRLRSQLQQMEIDAADVKSKLNDTKYKLQSKASVAATIEDLRAQISAQRDVITQADTELQQLSPKIAESQAKLDDLKRRSTQRLTQLNEDLGRLSSSVNQLQSVSTGINEYLDRNGEEQLKRAEQALQNLREEQARLEEDKGDLTKLVNSLSKQIDDHINIRKTIEANLRLRKSKRELQALKVEITELEAHDARKDYDALQTEATKWSNQRNALAAEQASMMGQMKSKDDMLAQLLQEWNTDYKDAAYKYKESNIKVFMTKGVVEDLARYGGALEKAIMKYHSLKMEEINRIIEELWKRTYQGTDIDTVLIRSDNETGKGNKSYNYRVSMIKQDVEMDMRGRCSAGQKVLASIIIRLALAECFGVACGLIALDEPTTNLDRENIRALAQSLHQIIKERRRQSNFQLIVITHDEEFLREMNCSEFCERYYRVSRDARQKSIIERQDISLVSI